MPTFMKELPDAAVKSSQLDSIKLLFSRTGAKVATVAPGTGALALAIFDTADSSQSAVDTLLSAPGDIAYSTSFGSTALGTNAIGIVAKCQAAKSAVYVKVSDVQIAGGTPVQTVSIVRGNLTDTTPLADTLTNKFAVTPAGNLYLQLVPNSNADAATSGSIEVELFYVPR